MVGGLEISVRFAQQDDRDRVVNAARGVGWSPIDLDVEQPDWQDEGLYIDALNKYQLYHKEQKKTKQTKKRLIKKIGKKHLYSFHLSSSYFFLYLRIVVLT